MAWIKVPTAAAAETTPASTTDDPVIIVSLGDSYSSGEGIEEFFGQDLPVEDKVQNLDWLAHRSTKAWSGMLTSDGFTGTASTHRNENWYFVAASGAKIEHLNYEQTKSYNYGGLKDDATLPAQLDILDSTKPNSVTLTENDYITITMGGNDVGFVDILTTAFVEELFDKFPLSVFALGEKFPDIRDKKITLEKLLSEKTTKEFETKFKNNLKNAYKGIKEKSDKATIIVAGYPLLFFENGYDSENPDDKDAFTVSFKYGDYSISFGFSAEKAHKINEAVTLFNSWIDDTVKACAEDAKDPINIHFVSVDDKKYFKGHEAYSSDPFINGIILNVDPDKIDQTIDGNMISSYSFHPNFEGAKAYAAAVQAKINDIEASKKSFSVLQERIDTIADGGTIVLDQDYTALSTDIHLVIPSNKTITIDLNGHTIDRNLSSAKDEGNVIFIKESANLTIIDSGSSSGMITGGNTTGYGGGIYNNGNLILKGGCITGNNANLGGGVYNNGTLKLSQTDNSKNPIVIIDNKTGTADSNVYLPNEKIITVDKVSITGSMIGVTVQTSPTGDTPVTITGNCKESISYFVSDNTDYVLAIDNGVAKLAVPVTVTFYKNDGSGITKEQIVYGGIETVLNSNTFKRDHYTFSGWATESDGSGNRYSDCGNITITKDTILYAQWTANEYLVEFVNENGEVLQSRKIKYGETPVYSEPTPTITPTAQYTYTFDKWKPEIKAVEGEATYRATYQSTINKYTIKFVNEDGTELQSSEVEYGKTPVYSKAPPTKAADAKYTYTFDKWDSDIVAVTGDATYKATYTSTTNKYKITFKNYDGTVLQSSEVEYGETPKYTGETPVKEPDEQYNYIFAKWDSDIVKVTGDATYTATFKQSTCRHTSVEKKVENKKDPTCTEEGSYDEVTYCELCKEELSRKTIKEDTTGHKWGDWEVVKKPTVTEKGTEQRVCANDPTHIETREIEKLPKMVYKSSFETVTWQKGSGKALTWTIHRAEDDKNCILHYWYTLLNGEKIPVDAKSGSTIITISAEILEKLSAGTHTITVVFDDGEVTLPLLISAATPSSDASPTTGDNSNPALWYLLTFCSLAGLALFTRYGRKRAEE